MASMCESRRIKFKYLKVKVKYLMTFARLRLSRGGGGAGVLKFYAEKLGREAKSKSGVFKLRKRLHGLDIDSLSVT